MGESGMGRAFEGFKLPRLERPDRVVWETPRWRCYCCHDTGVVQRPELIVEDYGINDPEIVCTNCSIAIEKWGREPTEEELARLGVKRSEWRSGLEIRDTRATVEMCRALDAWGRECWGRY